MSKYISCADTAKLIRQALKDAFKKEYPTTKFSVRSSVYSGGASISVEWIDGPCEPDVNRVIKQFQGATFDGMTDSTTYHTSELNGEKVRFGADYVNGRRNMSKTFIETIVAQFCKHFGLSTDSISVAGNDTSAYANFKNYDSKEHWLHDLLRNTDEKNMHRAYAAEDEKEAQERAKYEAQAKAQAAKEAKERAEAKAKAEQERIQRERKEFVQWQQEQLHNLTWQYEQFKIWREQKEQREREEAKKQEEQRQAEAKAQQERQRREQEERERRQREQKQHEQINAQKRTVLASRANALAYLGLSLNASRDVILATFRAKVKASADGKGGYTGDMDLLVKAKEKALQ